MLCWLRIVMRYSVAVKEKKGVIRCADVNEIIKCFARHLTKFMRSLWEKASKGMIIVLFLQLKTKIGFVEF